MRSSSRRGRQPSARWTAGNEPAQGDERGTYGTLGRRTHRKTGCPTGREAHGHGAAIVVASVTPGLRVWESHTQGEGQQGSRVPGAGRYAECGTPHLPRQPPARAGADPGKPDAGKLARPVWGRADRKGLGNQHLAGGLSHWKPVYNLLEGQ